MKKDAARLRGFTLVELLVVIAIITLLIAILLPIMWRIKRKAMVLACPIAYFGTDNRLHLTDPNGKMDLDLGHADISGMNTYPAGIAWSPLGHKVGLYSYGDFKSPPAAYATLIFNPMSGSIAKHQDQDWNAFRAWADSDGYISIGDQSHNKLSIRDAESFAIRQTISLPQNEAMQNFFLAKTPIGTDGYFVAVRGHAGGFSIQLLRKDMTSTRTIWMERSPDLLCFGPPKVDSTGDWVAWTYYAWKEGPLGVAIKRVKDSPAVQPTILPAPSEFAVFCDWAEDGNLLINASIPPRTG